MDTQLFITFFTLVTTLITALNRPALPRAKILSSVQYSLSNRYEDVSVNQVFAHNILLTLAYMSGKAGKTKNLSWQAVKKPASFRLTLKPGKTFAFHDEILEKYKDKVTTTTNAHFNSNEGFLSDGWLVGDGVCHLASFMNVVARSAGLQVEAPVRHDFARIAEVDKKDGVSIYYTPTNPQSSQLQNLYITNTRTKPIAFVFSHKGDSLDIQVQEL
ncbi:hypothetical protein A2866_01790 [Candidatus Roizmanbacteria bacterium RIFCSPHIGHO2_01_FULL_39_8]|uniref:Uncharacterized protein n=3 Tax=Candidatus Roizmaniibacteriota TaxID=1752723 RepID=A0A1F7GKF2_9BACT|nr:MAG: hypothetical protein A2866_01790 [Candidatus Roizmanbacteria bacterium RIFCSPHIGHO2_01_FULL_39_8]OGK25933.1 MAG: hypothetical protein A3C28_00645 [Candidatus Roizmanbacteria bacterium RIFCSPHIGHO2_02_FULL_39_9]OGK37654.1 MAG: hypothetical protein A3F60_01130 [Candidatus Roizmanbacteria bacterium RIFCSPHIGHO2_12_FULL_39_8]